MLIYPPQRICSRALGAEEGPVSWPCFPTPEASHLVHAARSTLAIKLVIEYVYCMFENTQKFRNIVFKVCH